MGEKLKATVQYRGWPGHFILSSLCVFRLHTLITCGERRVVVSTVGGMRTRDGNGFETVGSGRYYETMAFNATLQDTPVGPVWDLDHCDQLDIDYPRVFWPNILDELNAQAAHEAVVAEFVAKMEAANE